MDMRADGGAERRHDVQHHEQTLDAYVASVRPHPSVIAVILTGSVARGTERPDSDVDVSLVVTDEAFDAARTDERLSYVERGMATYDGGYVDVKVVSPAYLDAAVTRADEPTRASFVGARVVYARGDGLPALLERITRLPDAEWEDRIVSFIAQVRLYGGYFLGQGEKLQDPYLLHWAAVHLANASGRAILASARVLFRGPKYLLGMLAELPEVPPTLVGELRELLTRPSAETGAAVMSTVEAVLGERIGREQTLSRFVADNELGWLWHRPAPESI